MPESLPVPPETGLVALKLNGVAVALPQLDQDSRLWLKARAGGEGEAQQIDVRVHRLVSDDIPLVVTTHLELTAAGRSQEVALSQALLPDFVPLMLASPLPARIDADGKLRIQVRPGQWQITLAARHMAPLTALTLPKEFAAEEIWAFDARNELRLVTVEGVPAVDPQQTTLPPDWKRFPAYRLQPGESMKFNESKRGDPEPQPDKLSLKRNLWLDFDGGGYTIQDNITGNITRAWRLELAQPQQLGRAAIDDVDQYITRTAQDTPAGIEIRRGAANITADSRLAAAITTFSATGWLHDFNQLAATLHLPPGWQLLHVSGADRAPSSWIERWTLLDLFLVLILTLAVAKLFGWRWGLVALLGLMLSYHDAGAPRWAWLNLLAAVALLRVLPEGRTKWLIGVYRWIALLVLIVLLVPFAVDQIRIVLYPVLEQPWQQVGQGQTEQPYAQATMAGAPAEAPVAAAPEPMPEMAEQRAGVPQTPPPPVPQLAKPRMGDYSSGGEIYSRRKAAQKLDAIDPNARIQTGPGLPSWRWRDYPLVWNGPVQHTQQIKLWLLSPSVNGALTIAQLLLLMLLFLRLAEVKRAFGKLRGSATAATGIGCALLLLSAEMDRRAYAAQPQTPAADDNATQQAIAPLNAAPLRMGLPDDALLEQLKQKLLVAPDCLPSCAVMPRVRIEARGDALQLRLEAHAQNTVALPLPGGQNQWSPQRVLLDGKPAGALARDASGVLWVVVPEGVHQLALESSLAGRDAVQLGLPLRPLHVEAALEGWKLDGLNETGAAGESLLLTRISPSAASGAGASSDNLPPFVSVERTLNLGLTWTVATRVTRTNASRAPVLVEIPLLAGESVTQSDIRIENGAAAVNLGPQTTEFEFQSALKIGDAIALKAPQANNQIHIWRLNLTPQWHVQLSGIPVVHHQDRESNWLPQWRPWPGEEIKIAVTRPLGIDGQTLTIDRSHLQVVPGIRATDSTLSLSLRSSRGANHNITLPPASTLLSVAINGQTQPIRLENNIVRIPVTPGKQDVQIAWRENLGIERSFKTSKVDVGVANVNSSIELNMPEDRWTLFAGGPRVGPAILFWGVLIALIPIAYALSRSALAPIKWYQWLLLGIGLTQTTVPVAIVVVGWFFAVGLRRRPAEVWEKKWLFNLRQVALIIWTLLFLIMLFEVIRRGLLGLPEMQIAGNGSDAYHLRWYQDRSGAGLPSAWAISVPVGAYRILMLLWALWLAYSLLKWLRWSWEAYSSGGIWRKIEWAKPKPSANPRRSGAAREKVIPQNEDDDRSSE